MRESEQRFHTMADTVPVLIWMAGPDKLRTYFNRGWLDYTGLSKSEAAGWGWTVALHPEDLDRVLAHWHVMLARGQPGEIEARLRRFDGAYRWFLFRAKPLHDETQKIVCSDSLRAKKTRQKSEWTRE